MGDFVKDSPFSRGSFLPPLLSGCAIRFMTYHFLQHHVLPVAVYSLLWLYPSRFTAVPYVTLYFLLTARCIHYLDEVKAGERSATTVGYGSTISQYAGHVGRL